LENQYRDDVLEAFVALLDDTLATIDRYLLSVELFKAFNKLAASDPLPTAFLFTIESACIKFLLHHCNCLVGTRCAAQQRRRLFAILMELLRFVLRSPQPSSDCVDACVNIVDRLMQQNIDMALSISLLQVLAEELSNARTSRTIILARLDKHFIVQVLESASKTSLKEHWQQLFVTWMNEDAR
jgi:hypothetical protein